MNTNSYTNGSYPVARNRLWYPDGVNHFYPLGWDGDPSHNNVFNNGYDGNNNYSLRMTGYIDIHTGRDLQLHHQQR